MAGTVKTEKGHAATIWKDGVAITLTNKFTLTIPTGVCVDDNNDVYVTGYGSDAAGNIVAIVWKNGVAINLSDGTNDSRAFSVFVSQNDVYVAGYEYNETNSIAKLWKNGVAISLTDGTLDGYAHSVYVLGNDIYVAVYESFGYTRMVAKLWKNGVTTNLTKDGEYGTANRVFVG